MFVFGSEILSRLSLSLINHPTIFPLQVERLQYELSNQYLQYREERDARNLLIGQLSYLTSASVKEHPADENTGDYILYNFHCILVLVPPEMILID